jgi:4-hydroxybenzoate polyprenyltransferase
MLVMVKDPVTTSPFLAWIRVLRPGNLMIIAASIAILRWSYSDSIPVSGEYFLEMLFILPLVLLAAGGNIINDYFDIKEDRVNKPERALVGRIVKRRIALVSHWGLTALGLLIAGILSFKINSSIPFVIALLISIVLFLYSTTFKGRVLVGNVLVACAIASVVPFAFSDSIDTSLPLFQSITLYIWEFGWLTGLIFLIVFIRELVKDIEDLEGDKKAGHLTLPIIYGTQTSWKLIYSLLILLTIFVVYMQYEAGIGVVQGLFLGVYLQLLLLAWNKKPTKLSAWLKLLLAAGLLWLVLLG